MQESKFEKDFRDRIARGEPAAIADLLARFKDYIRKRASRRLAQTGRLATLDTSEVYSSVCLRFLERVSSGEFQVDAPVGLRAYFARMVRNRIADERRKELRRRELGYQPPQQSALGPEQAIQDADLRAHFRTSLPPIDQTILDRAAQGQKYAAIGAEVRLTPDAVRMRVKRLRRRLKDEGLVHLFPQLWRRRNGPKT